MSTITAVVLHALLGLLQFLGGSSASTLGFALPWWGQFVIQGVLVILQGLVAHKNSNSDPNGHPLPK